MLDNSLIQRFKHRKRDSQSGIRALAYTAFCRFATDWSDRPTVLALSPMAVYEHLGRTSPASAKAAVIALKELMTLLADTRLRCVALGFNTPTSLLGKLSDIEVDEQYLTNYVSLIDATNWKTDLRAPIGVKIPMSVAYDAIPDDLPLRYFDSWYVKFVLSARVEEFIVKQSNHNAEARPISSGALTRALADLNEFGKKGHLKGLGDIDLLQLCDVNRQYKEDPGYVLLGQTLDKRLAEVLNRRHVYSVSEGGVVGDPEGDKAIKRGVSLQFSNPFAEQDQRAERIRCLLDEFREPLVEACERALAQKNS